MPVETVPQRFEIVPIDSIEPHPENSNNGELEVIADSIERNGFYGVVIVQESTRRILAGEHRWKARKDLGADDVPVMLVDVDDDRAKRIMAVDNRSARLGYDDDRRLAALLQSFDGDLSGTGWTDDDLDATLRRLAALGDDPTNPSDEWVGMPEFEQDAKRAVATCVVHFPTVEAIDEFFEMLGRPRARSFWWPNDDGHKGSDVNVVYVADPEAHAPDTDTDPT